MLHKDLTVTCMWRVKPAILQIVMHRILYFIPFINSTLSVLFKHFFYPFKKIFRCSFISIISTKSATIWVHRNFSWRKFTNWYFFIVSFDKQSIWTASFTSYFSSFKSLINFLSWSDLICSRDKFLLLISLSIFSLDFSRNPMYLFP